jgi:hypothetical protein
MATKAPSWTSNWSLVTGMPSVHTTPSASEARSTGHDNAPLMEAIDSMRREANVEQVPPWRDPQIEFSTTPRESLGDIMAANVEQVPHDGLAYEDAEVLEMGQPMTREIEV